MVKNRPTNVGDIRDVGSIPGSGRSPKEGNGNSLQYSGEFNAERSVVGSSPYSCKESDMTEAT